MQTSKRLVALAAVLAIAFSMHAQDFVRRNGIHLTLNGAPFRYSGPNIEWLGLEGYGPADPMGPRFPGRGEIDDAFATAAEMGAQVVRSQTMGDTVGCPLCIEPKLDKFNQAAFQASDYALAVAAKHHMRLIITLIGDCATCTGGGMGQYLAWYGKKNMQEFFTDPAIIGAYERHIDAVLNHVNTITGIRYRDDPTIMAWENCNMCGIATLFLGGGKTSLDQVAAWSQKIGAHIKKVDPNHLYLDNTGIFPQYPKVMDNPSTDMMTYEIYPHWSFMLGGKGPAITASTFTQYAAMANAHGKAFIVNEFGWDRTDWKTRADLQNVLDTIVHDPNICGDDFWALQAHLDNSGFQPIPANSTNPVYAEKWESGQWWALYYPGVTTLVNTAADMAARAQQLRTHAYQMAGMAVPKHAIPPAPVITSVGIAGLIAWRGSAGAMRYSVERLDPATKQWTTICDKCATDEDDPWVDPHATMLGGVYRVIAWNADGMPSAPSQPR